MSFIFSTFAPELRILHKWKITERELQTNCCLKV